MCNCGRAHAEDTAHENQMFLDTVATPAGLAWAMMADPLDDPVPVLGDADVEFRTDFNLSGERKPGFDPETDPMVNMHYEPCRKCRGSGVFTASSGRVVGRCFTCKGEGKLAFKTAPEVRAANRDRFAAMKLEAEQAWIAQFPAEYGFIIGGEKLGDQFMRDMLQSIQKYGRLTDNQLAAVQRQMARTQVRKEEAVQRVAAAPTINMAAFARITNSFAKAQEKGVKRPKMRLDRFYFSLSPNGAIYIKALDRTDDEGGRLYLGKIVDGKFFRVRACTDDDQQAILAVVADPEAAANAYGQRTGTCSICGLELTAAESIERSIGPICYSKYF